MILELLAAIGFSAAFQVPAPATQPAAPQGPAGPSADSAVVYRGRAGELAVRPPRIETDIAIDGRLDNPVWRRAAVLTDFSQYSPVDGVPAEDSTEVRVWYSANAIYFGIRAREPHGGGVHATVADRDHIDGDDYVSILLDTFHDGRRAFLFDVNPLGIQADGIRSEGAGNAGNARDFSGIDLSPDFVFQSRGHVMPDGYEVEVRIPFKSIRYQSAPVQSWGIQIVRQVQHSGYQLTWTPAKQAAASFLAQSGTLEGLRDLHRGLVLDLNPVATTKVEGGPGAPLVSPTGVVLQPGRWRYDATPEVGGNVRWGVTTNLSLTATANPDFSQVEADAGQIVTDPRQTLFFPEKRPFFLEGIEQFQNPQQLIYTRQIINPIAAAKLTGKAAGTSIGLLSAVDQVDDDAGVQHHPVFNLLRLRRDLGAQSTAGLVYTDKTDGGAFNRVLGLDSRIYFKKLYFAEFTAAGSATRAGTGAVTRVAPLWNAIVDRTGHYYGFHYVLEGRHQDFQAQSGFLNRTGIAHAMFLNRLRLYGKPGALLETYTVFQDLEGTWDYDHFAAGRRPDDVLFSLNNNLTLRGGWQLTFNPALQSVSYPARLFTNYSIAKPVGATIDTVPFTGTSRLPNATVDLGVSSPNFQHFGFAVDMTVGRSDNFDEWSSAWVEISQVGLSWRPTERIRISPSFIHQKYWRYSDRSVVRVHRIPRAKLEYQLTRAIFFRFVGQYDSQWRDALRDDSRTEAPILLRDAHGTLQPTTPIGSNSFRHDWLFSYQPTPGTVFFAGYGSSLDGPSYSLRNLERTNDGFFFKVSYLFRM